MRENRINRWTRISTLNLVWIGVAVVALGLMADRFPRPVVFGAAVQNASRSVHFTDDFENGQLDAWHLPNADDWAILAEDGRHYLHMKRNREPLVPRRPMQFAPIKGVNVGSFDFRTRVRRAGGSMIIVFNYVDSLHFYYTHLSVDPGSKQPVHNGVFLVNNSPRVRIAGLDAQPALPDASWHQIRVVRDVGTGRIQVWSDVSSQPLFTMVDRTFVCGEVGIGSFDETGDFDDVNLRSDDGGCTPGTGPSSAASTIQ